MKMATSWPFFAFILLPISGIAFLQWEIFYIGVEEFFLLFALLWFSLFNKTTATTNKKIVLFLFLFLYILFYTFPYLDKASLELLKLVKPYFFILAVAVFFSFTNRRFLVEQNQLVYLIFIALVADVIIYIALIVDPSLIVEGIRKEFYLRNDIYRYFDASILLIQTLIILSFSIYKGQKYKIISVFLLFLLLGFMTLDRVFLVFGFISLLAGIEKRAYKFMIVCLMALVLGGGIVFNEISMSENSARFLNLLDIDLVVDELMGRFIIPVISGEYVFSAPTFLFGVGMDYKFYIPWYEYRGLNPYHNSVDMFFVTFFVKHGIIGLILFFYVIMAFTKNYPKILFYWLCAYLFFHNGAFVTSFLTMIVFMSFLIRPCNDK
jgi:hypothetical protein